MKIKKEIDTAEFPLKSGQEAQTQANTANETTAEKIGIASAFVVVVASAISPVAAVLGWIQPKRKERRVPDDEWIVTLKDGTKVDARKADGDFGMLKMHLRLDPGDVEQFYEYVCGRIPELPEALKNRFRLENQEAFELYKAVLINAAETDADGKLIGLDDPFEPNEHNDHVRKVARTAAAMGGVYRLGLEDELDNPETGWSR